LFDYQYICIEDHIHSSLSYILIIHHIPSSYCIIFPSLIIIYHLLPLDFIIHSFSWPIHHIYIITMWGWAWEQLELRLTFDIYLIIIWGKKKLRERRKGGILGERIISYSSSSIFHIYYYISDENPLYMKIHHFQYKFLRKEVRKLLRIGQLILYHEEKSYNSIGIHIDYWLTRIRKGGKKASENKEVTGRKRENEAWDIWAKSRVAWGVVGANQLPIIGVHHRDLSQSVRHSLRE